MNRPPLRVFLVAGEPSGDALGARLMAALKAETAGAVRFSGVGGARMETEGLHSLFPLSDIAVMGPLAILGRIATLIRRVRQTVRAAAASEADVAVMIDSPEFTHAVAKRLRKARPSLPIIDYVSPSVWAWRPGRARRMRAYIDHVLAILPFEPEAHRRLGGPPCTYVGHPLVERMGELRGDGRAEAGPATLLVLPGSRVTEVGRLMAPFGQTVGLLKAGHPDLRMVLPAFPAMRPLIERELATWPVQPELVESEADKFAAFRGATAALAASGTVTLELALARVPMVVAYRLDPLANALKWLVKAHSVVLPNLIVGRNEVPEFIQEASSPANLAAALAPLLGDTTQRRAQLAAFDEVAQRMAIDDASPSLRAARSVLDVVRKSSAIS